MKNERIKACPVCKNRNIWVLDGFTGNFFGQKIFFCKCPKCNHKGEIVVTSGHFETYEHAQARAIQYWNNQRA